MTCVVSFKNNRYSCKGDFIKYLPYELGNQNQINLYLGVEVEEEQSCQTSFFKVPTFESHHQRGFPGVFTEGKVIF